MEPASGVAGFLAQSDGIGRAAIFVLLAMSVASWYLIIAKAVQAFIARRRSARFLDIFWNSASLGAVAAQLERDHPSRFRISPIMASSPRDITSFTAPTNSTRPAAARSF